MLQTQRARDRGDPRFVGGGAETRTHMRSALSGLEATAVMSVTFAVHPDAPPPPKVVTDNAFRKLGLPPIPGAWIPAHLAFGATLAALRKRLGAPRVPFGLAVWLAGYATSLPLLGLYPALTRDHRRRAAASFASHVVFGAALRERDARVFPFSSASRSWRPAARRAPRRSRSHRAARRRSRRRSGSGSAAGASSPRRSSSSGPRRTAHPRVSRRTACGRRSCPRPQRFIPLRLAPGDVVDASTTVAGANVSFVLHNISRGTRNATAVKTAHKLDRSTAEWIAEAPSLCRTISSCQVVALSNFGTVQFTKVTATGGGVTGPLGVPTWRVTPVALLTSSSSPRYVAASNPYGAAPGPVTPGGRSFTVSFRTSFPGAVPPHPLAGAPLPSWVH